MTRLPRFRCCRPRWWGLPATVLWTTVLTCLTGLLGAAGPAAAAIDDACALKTAAVLTGDPIPNLEHEDMAAFVAEQLASNKFVELFSAFVNTRFNRGLAMSAEEDAVFYVVRHVLENDLPWTDLYLGNWGWAGPGGYPQVIDDPNGVGYFTAPAWVRRYAGNDLDGYMLFAAYRVVQNTTGIVLVPSPFNANADSNFEGRQRNECRHCHIDSAVALDKIARFFPRRTGFGTNMVLTPPENGAQELLNGRTVHDLRELLGALLETDDYKFWTCRLVFEYTYGRAESACEAPLFDQCVATLEATNDIRQAVATVVGDPSFCTELEVP